MEDTYFNGTGIVSRSGFVLASDPESEFVQTLQTSSSMSNLLQTLFDNSTSVIEGANQSDIGKISDIVFGHTTHEGGGGMRNLSGDRIMLPGSGDLPWYGHLICITTMLFIWGLGSAGNFLVIYIVCKEKQLQTPINMFLVNLSFSDFITSAFGSPFPLIASIMQRWPFGETMCIIYAFGMSLGGFTSITTLMVLAFERYLMIARPFRAADIKVHHSSLIIVLIWVYSLTLTLPPFFGWASYGPEGPYISCSVSWEKDDLRTKSYICFVFVLGFVLPVITIVFSYIGIVTTIKSTSQSQTTGRSATARAELRVTAMVAVMVFCFLLAWSPYAVVSLLVAFGGPKGRKLITPVVSVLPAIFAKSSTCYNPLIYVGLNTQFQNAWCKLFGIQREDDENQTRLTMSVAGGSTVGGPIQTVSKVVEFSKRNHSPTSSPSSSSHNNATFVQDQRSKTLPIPHSISPSPSQITPPLPDIQQKKLNKADNSVVGTTSALELEPLTCQEPQGDLEEENNGIHVHTSDSATAAVQFKKQNA